jgi:hypothetical protein
MAEVDFICPKGDLYPAVNPTELKFIYRILKVDIIGKIGK